MGNLDSWHAKRVGKNVGTKFDHPKYGKLPVATMGSGGKTWGTYSDHPVNKHKAVDKKAVKSWASKSAAAGSGASGATRPGAISWGARKAKKRWFESNNQTTDINKLVIEDFKRS
jgi:hypothetical protein